MCDGVGWGVYRPEMREVRFLAENLMASADFLDLSISNRSESHMVVRDSSSLDINFDLLYTDSEFMLTSDMVRLRALLSSFDMVTSLLSSAASCSNCLFFVFRSLSCASRLLC